MSTPWFLEVVRVSSHEKQQDLLTLLREVVDVTALGSTKDDEYFVVFDCPDRRVKAAIEKLFSSVDADATTTYEFRRPPQQQSGGDGGAA